MQDVTVEETGGWMDGWMDVMSPICINHGGTWRSIMIMYIRVIHIFDHVLVGKKVTERCQHEATYTEIYAGLHLGNFVIELQICNET